MDLIPKKIHYCWFGGQPLTPLGEACVASWEKYLPGYELVRWDEKNFDVTANIFTKQAYEAGKYAFVSDYVRLWALYELGGIYMDCDVEVLRNLDEFLCYPAFSGFEKSDFIPTGIIGAQKGHPWVGRFLEYYRGRPFIREDGSPELVANVIFMSEISEREFGFVRGNRAQVLEGGMHIFPNDWFCPMIWETREIVLTENTRTIHHFSASWM